MDEASLAVARYLQDTTGMSIARIVCELHGLQEVVININGHHINAAPQPGGRQRVCRLMGFIRRCL